MREELAQVRAEFRHDLEMWGGALLARIEASERGLGLQMYRLEERLEERMSGMEQRLLGELARHVGTIQETFTTQIKVVDRR